jgi:hypothetical protein
MPINKLTLTSIKKFMVDYQIDIDVNTIIKKYRYDDDKGTYDYASVDGKTTISLNVNKRFIILELPINGGFEYYNYEITIDGSYYGKAILKHKDVA